MKDEYGVVDQGANEFLQPPEIFPDFNACRVKHSREKDALVCLGNWAWRCPFSLSLGDMYLCRHPSGPDFQTPHQGGG